MIINLKDLNLIEGVNRVDITMYSYLTITVLDEKSFNAPLQVHINRVILQYNILASDGVAVVDVTSYIGGGNNFLRVFTSCEELTGCALTNENMDKVMIEVFGA